MHLVHLLQQIELLALLRTREQRVVDIHQQFIDGHVGRDHTRGLILRGEERIAPQRRSDNDLRCRPEHHVSWQIFILAAQTIEHP